MKKKVEETKIDAWHFVSETRKLQHGSGLLVEPGYVYSEPKGPLIICRFGMHAARHPFDALRYAPGPILCRVRCWGDVQEEEDKLVCRHREVVWMYNMSRELRLFACWCVRETPLFDGRKLWDLVAADERSKNSVETAERFANGLVTRDDLTAAWCAWRGTVWEAGWGAARETARGAAQEAAQKAAWGAAQEAARGAAWWGNARGAAREAATLFHRVEFARIVSELQLTA